MGDHFNDDLCGELIDAIMDCIEIDYEHPVITELGVAFTIDRQRSRENMYKKGIIRTCGI